MGKLGSQEKNTSLSDGGWDVDVDEDGPFIVRSSDQIYQPGDICAHGNSWSANCSDCDTEAVLEPEHVEDQ